MENNFLDNESLVNEITYIIVNARNNVIKNVNNELINAYWNIGRIIVEDELKSERGEYGEYSGVAEPYFPLKKPPIIPMGRANLSANKSQ